MIEHIKDNWPLYLIGGLVIFFVVLILLIFIPARQEQMTVRSKEWQYTIKELEDYQVWACYRKYYHQCSRIGNVTSCIDIPYQDCHWETRTRTHNTWITGGQYPIEPFWEENYTIALGHYERRFESYKVKFSDDKQLYDYGCSNLTQYNQFIPRNSYLTTLNYYNAIIDVKP